MSIESKWAIMVWRVLNKHETEENTEENTEGCIKYETTAEVALLSPHYGILASEAMCEKCKDFFIPTENRKICFMCYEIDTLLGEEITADSSTNSSVMTSPSSSFNAEHKPGRIIRSSPRDERLSPGKSPKVSAKTRLFKHTTY